MVRLEREKNGKILKTFISDKLTQEDYFKLLPALQHTVNEGSGVCWYIELRDFSGWEPIAALQKLKFDIEHAYEISKIAIAGPKKWQEWLTNAMVLFTAAEVRFFDQQKKEEAYLWIKS